MDKTEKLDIDLISQVGHGGDYLTHPTTFERFRERWMPTMADWDDYDTWRRGGSQDAVTRATQRLKAVLAQCRDTYLEPDLDRTLKAFLSRN